MKYFNYQSLISLAKAVQLLLVLLTATFSLAQKGIGTNQPNPQAILDIQSPDKGVLFPRISLTNSSTLFPGVTATASHTGMLVYNTNTATNTGLVGAGYYVWEGSQWEKVIMQDDLLLQSVPQLKGGGQLTDDGSLLLDDGFSTFVQGEYAYVVSRDNPGLQIIDISDPANPVGVGQLADDGNLSLDGLRNVVVQGDYAYTISVSEGFQIIDVSDPTNPVGAGRLVDDGTLLLNGSWDLDVQGNYAYVTSLSENGIQIIDISDPTNPRGVGQLADTASLMLGGAFSIVVQGNYAYVTAYAEDGFQVIDVSDPTNPVGLGKLVESASVLLQDPYYVFVEGNYAYVPSLTEDGIQIIDITDPNDPVGVGQLADSADLLLDGAFRVFTQGNYAYVTAFLEGLQVIDISDPANPVGVAQLADDATLHLENARGLFVQGNQAYVTGSGGFQIVQLGTNELYGLDVGTLKASSLQVDNHAQFNNSIAVKGGLSVGASAKFEGNVSLGSSLRDATGDVGTAGQVLSSTSTGTDWIAGSIPIDNLNSTSAEDPLSANQGRVLNNMIQALDLLPETQRNIAYLQASHSQNFLFPAINTPTPIPFNTNDEDLGIGHDAIIDNTEITIRTSAIYTIVAQPQVFSGTNAGTFHMWLQRDQGVGFVDVPNSNVELILGNNQTDVIVLTSVGFLAKDDKIRVMGSVNDPAVILEALTPAGEPTIPAVILAMYANATGVNIQTEILGIADASAAPPTTNINDSYVLTNIASIDASWGSIANLEEGDVVLYDGIAWVVSLDASTQFNAGEYQVYNTTNDQIYYFTGTEWKLIGDTTNTITNELIFDGEDDPSGTYDNYYYISMLINGTDWKVVRYDKTDVNAEAEATITNNPGVTTQPTSLAACITLTF